MATWQNHNPTGRNKGLLEDDNFSSTTAQSKKTIKNMSCLKPLDWDMAFPKAWFLFATGLPNGLSDSGAIIPNKPAFFRDMSDDLGENTQIPMDCHFTH